MFTFHASRRQKQYDKLNSNRHPLPLSMYIHHLYISTLLIIHCLSSKNCVLKYHHLRPKLQHHVCNRHYLVVTLKRLSNLDIHHSLKSHVHLRIYKTTSKSLTTNLNQREIQFLLILLLVPQLLPATHLPLRHLHGSHAILFASNEVPKAAKIDYQSYSKRDCKPSQRYSKYAFAGLLVEPTTYQQAMAFLDADSWQSAILEEYP